MPAFFLVVCDLLGRLSEVYLPQLGVLVDLQLEVQTLQPGTEWVHPHLAVL